MTGSLDGIRIIEMAGIGPGPFGAMMLADHGAEVIRINRDTVTLFEKDPLARSRKSIVVNLKSAEGVELVRDLTKTVDGLIEGYRPGVMERLGLGPDVLLADNPKLVYGRMTGWGQTGPYAHAAGHDLNYISLNGVLHSCGHDGKRPRAPVNYAGDFGGGGMLLAFGMVSALLGVKNGAPGQVVDCAMAEGSALLMEQVWELYGMGVWHDTPGKNFLDGGAFYYDTYETGDGKFIAVGPLEMQFYALLQEKLGLTGDPDFHARDDEACAKRARKKLEEIFRSCTRDEWCEMLEQTDVCFAPVLSMSEAPLHPQNVARGLFLDVGGVTQVAPAPKFSATPPAAPRPAPAPGARLYSLVAGKRHRPTRGLDVDEQ